jgi:hypothetical protein
MPVAVIMIITMALVDPTPDPVDEDVERILADPDILASLEEFDRDLERGDLKVVADDEARRAVGVPPASG